MLSVLTHMPPAFAISEHKEQARSTRVLEQLPANK